MAGDPCSARDRLRRTVRESPQTVGASLGAEIIARTAAHEAARIEPATAGSAR